MRYVHVNKMNIHMQLFLYKQGQDTFGTLLTQMAIRNIMPSGCTLKAPNIPIVIHFGAHNARKYLTYFRNFV